MTHATNAGFKVGEYYRVTSKESGFKVGAIVKFTEDDGGACPRFDGKNIDKDGWEYVFFNQLDPKALKKTPAMEAGLIWGKKYKVIGKYGGHKFPVGTKVKLYYDDGTNFPEFIGKVNRVKETWYLHFDEIEILKGE